MSDRNPRENAPRGKLFEKGHKKLGGRKPGAKNKMTSTFKEAIAIAYSEIGGHEAFAKWAKQNRSEFYKIAARLIPTELVGTGDDGEHVVRVIHDAR